MSSACLTWALLSLAVVSAQASDDTFERLGWEKVMPLQTPEPVASELGSEEPMPLLVVEDPGITLANHLVAGEMRFANVAGTGYLEMWTFYPDGGRFFTRTLAEFGAMKKMTGSSDWRAFMLPFEGAADRIPSRLEINAVLPGGGEIEFRAVALYQSERPGGLAWWTGRTGALVGSGAGSVIGLAGALCGMLAAFGKARRFVLGVLIAGIALGIALLAVGIVAYNGGQPYAVWYPLVLLGAIATLIAGVSFPLIRRSYANRAAAA